MTKMTNLELNFCYEPVALEALYAIAYDIARNYYSRHGNENKQKKLGTNSRHSSTKEASYLSR